MTAATPAELELAETQRDLAAARAAYRSPKAEIAELHNRALLLRRRADRERGEQLAIEADPEWPVKVERARIELREAESALVQVRIGETPRAERLGIVPGAPLMEWTGNLSRDRARAEENVIFARAKLRRLRQWPLQLAQAAEVRVKTVVAAQDVASFPLTLPGRLRDKLAEITDAALRDGGPAVTASAARARSRR